MFRKAVEKIDRCLQQSVIILLRIYQRCISPFLGNHCRFYPSCSEYARESFQRFGFLHGSWLTFLRLCRCHPFCQGGNDPVPELKQKK